MKKLSFPLLILLLAFPITALAQSKLGSSNFSLDSINFGSNFTITTSQNEGVPPAISSEGPTVTALDTTQVTISWKTDKKSGSKVQYGDSSTYGQETGTTDLATTHSVTIFGLTPNTTYHFKVVSTDSLGSIGQSGDKTFTTPSEAGITGIKISDVGYDKALVAWRTGQFTNSTLEYGPTTNYGQSQAASSLSLLTEHTVQLTSLKPGVDYHLRIAAKDQQGHTTRSSDFTFTTLANPSFLSITPTVKDANNVEVNITTNTFTSIALSYKSSNDKGELSAASTSRAARHTILLSSLFGDSTYTFSTTATDEQGHVVTQSGLSFKTLEDKIPPVIDALKVKVSRSGNELVLTTTWQTNEPATSEATLTSKQEPNKIVDIPEQGILTTNHILVKSGIDPAITYDLTAQSKDAHGNPAKESINFISPSVRKGIAQLLLESIMRPFGWLARLFK